MHAPLRTTITLCVLACVARGPSAGAAPWIRGEAADELLRPWSACDALAGAVAPLETGETLSVRKTPGGVDVNRYGAGSGRWATASETTLRLSCGSCAAIGFSLVGGKESLHASLTLIALSGAATPALAQIADLASAEVVANADRPELAAARILIQLDGEPPPASAELLGPAAPIQPEHPGLPRGAGASVWSTAMRASAGLGPPARGEDSEPEATFVWPLRAPVALMTAGRWQLWEMRFRARLGGGLLAVYDRQSRRHRWLLATEADNRTPSHFEVLHFRGDLLLVRTRLDAIESLWAIDVRRGVVRPVQRGGAFRIVPRGVELTGELGEVSTLPFSELTP
jgi:hypothetical protein